MIKDRIGSVLATCFVVACTPSEPETAASNEETVGDPQPVVTRDACLALTDPSKLTACLEQLKAQEDTELARLEAENASKREELARLEVEANDAEKRLEDRILENEPN